MTFMFKPNRQAWLWWISAIALSIGFSVYILLKPADYDLVIQKYRAIALVAGILIAGLCAIIGTSKRWFGKDL